MYALEGLALADVSRAGGGVRGGEGGGIGSGGLWAHGWWAACAHTCKGEEQR